VSREQRMPKTRVNRASTCISGSLSVRPRPDPHPRRPRGHELAQVVLVPGHVIDMKLFEIGLTEYLDDHLFGRLSLHTCDPFRGPISPEHYAVPGDGCDQWFGEGAGQLGWWRAH
jgi:hypothetical protein